MLSGMPRFPSGAAGAGLLLLRGSVACSLLPLGASGNVALWQQLGIGAAILCLAAGYQVRIASAVCLLFVAEHVLGAPSHLLTGLAPFLGAAALALTGPGAFSIDARLFGRRIIVLPRD